MKIILTGSLGHISKPLAVELIQKGHSVTVISSNSGKQKEIETLGATAAIGSIEDLAFLSVIYNDGDAVYCRVPPADNNEPDRRIFYSRIATNYVQAIKISQI